MIEAAIGCLVALAALVASRRRPLGEATAHAAVALAAAVLLATPLATAWKAQLF